MDRMDPGTTERTSFTIITIYNFLQLEIKQKKTKHKKQALKMRKLKDFFI